MDSHAILANVINKTNLDLIDKICKIKVIYSDEKEKMIQEFIKPNYYNPGITKYYKNETK